MIQISLRGLLDRLLFVLSFLILFAIIGGLRAQTELLNVSDDPTCELCREIKAAFVTIALSSIM